MAEGGDDAGCQQRRTLQRRGRDSRYAWRLLPSRLVLGRVSRCATNTQSERAVVRRAVRNGGEARLGRVATGGQGHGSHTEFLERQGDGRLAPQRGKPLSLVCRI